MATNFWKGGPGLSSSPAAGSLGRRSRSRPSGSADAYKIPDRWILWVPFQDRGAGEVNRRNFCEALRKGIGTDRRFAPSEGFRKGSDGMASATPTRCPGFPNCGKIGFRGPPIPGGRTFSFTVPAKNPAAADCRRFRFPTGGTGRRAGRAGCARRRRCGTGQRLDREAGGDPADGCPSESAGRFFPCWTRKEAALKGEGWTVPSASPGAALRCPVVFLQAPFRPIRRACLFDLHPGRISGRRRLYGAHRPFGPAGWTGESPQGPVRDGERRLRSAPGRVR